MGKEVGVASELAEEEGGGASQDKQKHGSDTETQQQKGPHPE